MTNVTSVPTHAKEQDLIYKVVGEREIALTFIPPINPIFEKAPVYFEITGGGWCSGNRTNMINFARRSAECLRERGWAVVSTDYRLINQDPDVTIDEVVSDVMDAVRYITKYADPLEIDPSKILAIGHSAGSHLAMMLAYAPHDLFRADSVLENDFSLMGCISFSGISVLYPKQDGNISLGFSHDYLYRNKTYDDAAAHRCSPYDYITKDSVPTLFIHGSKDPLVFPENATLPYHKGIECGANFEMLISQNGGHCLESLVDGEPVYPTFGTVQWMIPGWVKKTFGI